MDGVDTSRDLRCPVLHSHPWHFLMVGIVVMMVIPVPSVILDLLLTLNIAAAVMIMLASLNVTRALDLASFPSILLIATLFRLGLNVSTTR